MSCFKVLLYGLSGCCRGYLVLSCRGEGRWEVCMKTFCGGKNQIGTNTEDRSITSSGFYSSGFILPKFSGRRFMNNWKRQIE